MSFTGSKLSISKSISLAILASIIFITVLSMTIAGYVITNQFNKQAEKSSALAGNITELSLNQFVSKIAGGIDSITNDNELARDILLSLTAPNPRRKNFYKLIYRLQEFGVQYKLNQVSLYLKSSSKGMRIFGAVDVDKNHVFSYSTKKPGKGLKEIARDDFGIIATKEDGLRKYDFSFPTSDVELKKNIVLLSKEGHLFLSLTYPIINNKMGSEKDEGQFIVKGMTYGFVNVIIPIPDSFVGELESRTNQRISFFNKQNQYLLGVNKLYKDQVGYVTTGSDDIDYINYITPVKMLGQDIAKISTSMRHTELIGQIVETLGTTLASVLFSALIVLYFLNKGLGQLIVAPIQCLSEIASKIASGDLSQWKSIADHTEKKRYNEIDILSKTFKDMSSQLEQLINEKIKDIESMLGNIRQGILTIDKECNIHPEYSNYLETIFETKEIGGKSFVDFMFQKAKVSKETITTTDTVITTSIGDDEFAFDANSQHLPRSFSIVMDESTNSHKDLELEWCPILNEEDLIEKIMVTVRDITEINKLKAEANLKSAELEIIEQLMGLENKKFQEVYSQSEQMLQSCLDTFNSNDINSESLGLVFMHLHTAKGTLRTYGLKNSSAEIHDIEDFFVDLKHHEGTYEEYVPQFVESLEQAIQNLKQYKFINDTRLNRNSTDSGVTSEVLQEVRAVVDLYISDAIQAEKLFNQIEFLVSPSDDEALAHQLEDLIERVAESAKDLGKASPNLIYIGPSCRIPSQVWQKLEGSFTHLIRNSLDHGIETPEQRAAIGKREHGAIHLELHLTDREMTLIYYDDGQGLNIEKLRSLGKLGDDASDKDVSNLIFQPSLSTASNVTDISGRGVGMEAVKWTIEEIGGQIHLELDGQDQDKFRPIKFVITLPLELLTSHHSDKSA